MEGAQNVKVEIIIKIKPKGKRTVNWKRKVEEGGYYTTLPIQNPLKYI
jgi:hypothetical protein